MSDQDFDDAEVEGAELDEDLPIGDLDEDDDDLDVDLLGDEDEEGDEGEEGSAAPGDADEAEILDDDAPAAASRRGGTARRRARTDDEDEDDVVDLDDELHPDDVEEPLDVLLAERTASERLEEDDLSALDEEVDSDGRGEGPTRIAPRRTDEFLCSSCFLVLPRNQLADPKKLLCRDCA